MKVTLHEILNGDPIREIPFSKLSWSSGICTPDSLSVTVPAYTEDIRGLSSLLVPRKMGISIVDDSGVVRVAGVLGIPEYKADDDGLNVISLTAQGVESLYERRHVLPYPFGNLVDSEGYPDPRWDTRISGVQYGTMIKKLYTQAMDHPNGSIPAVFEDDRTGTRQKEWYAVSGKKVQEAVQDISELIGGVEWDWVPRLDEADRLSFYLATGTDNNPEITSSVWHTWSLGGDRPDVRGWQAKVTPEFMTSSVFFTGGKDEDRVMVSHREDSTLLDAGFPLSEVWDSSHSSVSDQGTLDSWAAGTLAEGQAPTTYWTFQVRTSSASSVRHGDWCTLDADHHWMLPDGTYSRRVVDVSGTEDPDWISITVAGDTSW